MTRWNQLATEAVRDCIARPVSEGEAAIASELNYFNTLGGSYIDTVERVGVAFDELKAEHPRVLELGSFFGPVSIALARSGARVTAQDRSDVMIAPLRQRYEREGIEISIVDDVSHALPYADDSFDALICCEVLEHLPFNAVRLIKEFRRILSPNGFAFISVPNQASLKRRAQLLFGQSIRDTMAAWLANPHQDNWHWREYVGSELRELLRGTGFDRVELGYRHFIPPTHRSPLRRGLLHLLYSVKPALMDDLFALAR